MRNIRKSHSNNILKYREDFYKMWKKFIENLFMGSEIATQKLTCDNIASKQIMCIIYQQNNLAKTED